MNKPMPPHQELGLHHLDELLRHAAEGLQLTQAQYDLAMRSAQKVEAHLRAPGSPFLNEEPQIYPQGSMAQGTTNRPLAGKEFDLDLILQLNRDHRTIDPALLLDILYRYLRTHPDFSGKDAEGGDIVEKKERCARINFRGDFHLDVVPVCIDLRRPPNGVMVPNRATAAVIAASSWKESNPKETTFGFLRAAARKRESQRIIEAKEQPLPMYESAYQKAPLKLVNQLIKRNRDLFFAKDIKLATPSICIAALTAQRYEGEPSVAVALMNAIHVLAQYGRDHLLAPRLVNPWEAAEIISEKWEDEPRSWSEYQMWTTDMETKAGAIQRSMSMNALKALFGESSMTDATRLQAKAMQRATEQKKLSVDKAGMLAASMPVASVSAGVRPHHFYGG